MNKLIASSAVLAIMVGLSVLVYILHLWLGYAP